MIHIPAGTYEVGSTAEQRQELARQYGFHPSMLADELPARRVALQDFFVDEYPVTYAEYAAFLRDTGAPEPYDWPLHATADRADHPVVGVGGSDAAAYAEWAHKRLPSPEEWEAAFRGIGQLPDRAGPVSHWVPQTHPRTADPGPVSDFGVRGFGQVCEWTRATTSSGPFPFRLLKGAAWLCREGWSLRAASGFYAFAPWCRQWTGLRCVSDTDAGPAPTAALPKSGQPTYHNAHYAKDGVSLAYSGGHGVSVALPGVSERLGICCPEGCIIDGQPLAGGDYEGLGCPGGATETEVAYRLRLKDVEMTASFRAGRDYLDMNYTFTSRAGVPRSIRASSCVNAGLLDPFYDLEGSRTYVWPGAGPWRPVRSLDRGARIPRWIRYVTLPATGSPALLVAVVGKDGRHVFGYGRAGSAEGAHLANNYCFSCIHVDPTVTVAAGGSGTARSRLYCMQGGLNELRDRFIREFGVSS